MQRYKLTIEYDGTPFAGWQLQHNALSIQGIIEEAFKQLSQESPRLHVAGRTDAGVHALGQVAHLDLSKNWDPYRLMMASNFYLKPYPIKILKVEAVSADFHARFSAKSRSYFYRILRDLLRSDGYIFALRGAFYAEVSLIWGFISSILLIWEEERADPNFIFFLVVTCVVGSFLTRMITVKYRIQGAMFGDPLRKHLEKKK